MTGSQISSSSTLAILSIKSQLKDTMEAYFLLLSYVVIDYDLE